MATPILLLCAPTGVNQPQTVYGLSGWSNSNFYQSAANGAPDSPASWGLLMTADGALSAASFTFNQLSTGAFQGWAIGTDNTGAPLVRTQEGATGRSVAAGALVAHDKVVHVIVGTYDGATVKLYVDGAYIGSIGNAGYSPPGATLRTAIGKSAASNFPATNVTVVGAITGTVVLSDAEVAAWMDACAAAGDVVAFPSGTDYLYSVKQSAQDAPTTWPAVVGTQDLTKNGTVTARTITDASFGFNTDALITTRLYNQIRVQFRGDSISSGVGSTDSLGFRSLIDALVAADADFTIRRQDQAVSGSAVQHHLAGGAYDPALTMGPGKLVHPQICSIMLGTNNTGSDVDANAAIGYLQTLIEQMYALEPRMRFVLCHVTQNPLGGVVQARCDTINAGITSTVVPAILGQNIPLVVCSATASGLDNGTDFSSGAHPNDAGYTKLAAMIYPKLRLAAGWPEE